MTAGRTQFLLWRYSFHPHGACVELKDAGGFPSQRIFLLCIHTRLLRLISPFAPPAISAQGDVSPKPPARLRQSTVPHPCCRDHTLRAGDVAVADAPSRKPACADSVC